MDRIGIIVKLGLLLVVLSGFSQSLPSQKVHVGLGHEARFPDGIVITEEEFGANAYGSAAIGTYLKPTNSTWCSGVLISKKHFLVSRSTCDWEPKKVFLGSVYNQFFQNGFDGQEYDVVQNHAIPNTDFGVFEIPFDESKSKARPIDLPVFKNIPPPAGTKCTTFGYSKYMQLNRLAVTIIGIHECRQKWREFNPSVEIIIDGSVFCAWVTKDGTGITQGNICSADYPPVVICENWERLPRNSTLDMSDGEAEQFQSDIQDFEKFENKTKIIFPTKLNLNIQASFSASKYGWINFGKGQAGQAGQGGQVIQAPKYLLAGIYNFAANPYQCHDNRKPPSVFSYAGIVRYS